MAFPANFNISYYSGDTYEFVIAPKNSDGTDFSLTGYTAGMRIATSRGSSPTFSTTAQTVVNTTLNTVTCTILPGVGNTLTPGITYVYDVQIVSGSTKVFTLLTGNINITEDVTP
jgi:hypothetical protein